MRALVVSRGCFLLVVSLTALLLLAGCVSRGTYNEVVEERDQLRRRSAALTGVAAGLGSELMLRDRQVALLEREQQELADEVARWAVRGAIQMQLLADGLHLILPHLIVVRDGDF